MTEQLSVLEWAEERLANTLHIAPTKTGDDRAGWLEDAAYWSAIVDELRDVRRLRAELQAAQAVVTQLRDFVARERELRDGLTAGGQHVGYGPSISPTTLRTLERMLPQAHPTPAQEGPKQRTVAGYPCPSSECPFCSGEQCWTHSGGCNCDVLERHEGAPAQEGQS